jgi:superfamily I DNA/RNA helicase
MVAAREEEGERIGMKMYWQLDDEAEAALVLAQKDPLHSIVLARTNHVVGVLERICAQNKIKYHLLGKTSFWKQAEISKALEALKPFTTSPTEMAMNMALPALEAKYAVDDRTERDNDALANLRILRTYAKEHPQTREFLVYANKMVHRRNDARGVTLSTVHQAKGLEFSRVFIVGANADGFPHKKGEPLEEARIWYVAISRAANTLRISFSGTPSPYLRKYLTEEILGKLAETAHEVERLQIQGGLFT